MHYSLWYDIPWILYHAITHHDSHVTYQPDCLYVPYTRFDHHPLGPLRSACSRCLTLLLASSQCTSVGCFLWSLNSQMLHAHPTSDTNSSRHLIWATPHPVMSCNITLSRSGLNTVHIWVFTKQCSWTHQTGRHHTQLLTKHPYEQFTNRRPQA